MKFCPTCGQPVPTMYGRLVVSDYEVMAGDKKVQLTSTEIILLKAILADPYILPADLYEATDHKASSTKSQSVLVNRMREKLRRIGYSITKSTPSNAAYRTGYKVVRLLNANDRNPQAKLPPRSDSAEANLQRSRRNDNSRGSRRTPATT